MRTLLVLLAILAANPASLAQRRFIASDRTSAALWRFADANGDGAIDSGEVNVFFDGTNASGVAAPATLNALSVRRDGLVAYGDTDSGRRNIVFARDNNGNGNAQDAGEARVVVDSTNASGIILTAPQGTAFDSRGRLYVANSASSSAGADAIYRLVDLNGNGDFQDAGEITEYVGVPYFGPGNGPRVPIEIVFDSADVLWLRESSAGAYGIHRFQDIDGNGRADDPGEATVFFDTTNQSTIAIGAGFGLDIDPVRPRSFYIHNLGALSTDQVIRVSDLDNDGDANDAGEAQIVFATNEDGFTSVDVLALYDGRILFTNTVGPAAVLLTDLDADNLFSGAGERTTFYSNPAASLGSLRQINILPCPGDWDRNKAVTPADVAAFVNAWFTSVGNGTFAGDFDFNGVVNPADVASFVNAWFNAISGAC